MIATPKLEGTRLEQLLAQVEDIRRKLTEIGQNDENPEETISLTKRLE